MESIVASDGTILSQLAFTVAFCIFTLVIELTDTTNTFKN